jgi:hypothetical protein
MTAPDSTPTDVPAETDAEAMAAAEQEAPDAYVISRDLAQATLNYLAAQPYREVFALVQGFETLEAIQKLEPDANGRP